MLSVILLSGLAAPLFPRRPPASNAIPGHRERHPSVNVRVRPACDVLARMREPQVRELPHSEASPAIAHGAGAVLRFTPRDRDEWLDPFRWRANLGQQLPNLVRIKLILTTSWLGVQTLIGLLADGGESNFWIARLLSSSPNRWHICSHRHIQHMAGGLKFTRWLKQ